MKIADVRITVLIDNYSIEPLSAEHGLSLFVSAGGNSILFDTGQGGGFAGNAGILGVNLAEAGAIVLSHGHYDHAGGLPLALERAPQADVFCHPGVVVPRYSIKSDGTAKPVHIPSAANSALNKIVADRVQWVTGMKEVVEDLFLTGRIPRLTDYEDTGGRFYLDPDGVRPDPVQDDIALWINTDHGLVCVVGCAHSGLINTLEYIRRISGESRIHSVIGGFHLVNAGIERRDKTIAALETMGITLFVPCHCTGDIMVRRMQSELNGTTIAGKSGIRIGFEETGTAVIDSDSAGVGERCRS